MELKKLISEYLADARVMQLATVKDNQPWVCTVNYICDENWNLYWFSLKTRRHSQELMVNSKVAATIVKDPSVKRAIQLEGIGGEVEKNDLERVHNLYGARYGETPQDLISAQSGRADVRTYYMLKPTKIVLFDEINFPDNPRQEYKQ